MDSSRLSMKLVCASTLFSCTLLFPALALAAQNAGLVDGVWFSSSQVTEGEPVTLYAVVLNQSTSTASGSVTFSDAGFAIGSAQFSVPPDSVARVSLAHSFLAGTHSIKAAISGDPSTFVYESLSSRTLLVDLKPLPSAAAAPGTGGSGGGSGGGSSSGTSSSASSTTSTGILSTIVNSVAAATRPLASSLTASRDKILGVKRTATSSLPASALDVITPSKNLFDVTVEIMSGQNHLSWGSRAWAFFLTLLVWLVYCLLPLLLLLILYCIYRRLRRNRK